MKRGHKRLLAFEISVFIFLILNSFVWNILSGYKISVFIALLLVFFKFVFGFEKDKHRYVKDIIMEVIIFLILFFMLYYVFGIVISFYKNGNYFTFEGITKFIIPAIIYAGLREFLRYMVMCKAEGSKVLLITSIVMFVMLDITTSLHYGDFSTSYGVFLFIALTLLPAISLNSVFSYFTLKTGYKPLMLYSIVMGTYSYILPIIPNPSKYVMSIISFLLPVVFGYRLYLFFKKYARRKLDRNYRKKGYYSIAECALFIVILVYFTSGYFHYWAIAVASGSMHPKINKGDVAIIEKIDKNYSELEKGQVIAFKYDDVIIVHRLINIVQDKNKYYFYTKGDANEKPDNFVIEQNKVIGVVNHRIPFIGIPTVWLSELQK